MARGFASKEARDLIKWAEEHGWTHSITGSNHFKFEHPAAEKAIFTPCTPRVHGNHKEKAKLRTALRRGMEAG